MSRPKRTLTLLAALAIPVLFLWPSGPGAESPDDVTPAAPSRSISGDGRIGVYLTSYAPTKASIIEDVLMMAERGWINCVVINVKDMHGDISYSSAVPLARTIGAATNRLNFAELLPLLRSHGLYLIARQVLFYDPLLARHLGISSDWVPADDPQAVAYNLAIADEVASLGFDEIQFDYIRYADGGGLAIGYEARYRAVNAFLAEARDRLSGRVALSADIFGRVLWPWNMKKTDPIGQSLEEMAPYLDYISPMVYPSHYAEAYYQNDPYRCVSDSLNAGTARVQANFRPFLQVFDRHIPITMTIEDYILAQIRATRDAGSNGYLFWNPASDYSALICALSR